MAQSFSTTIGLSANAASAGQAVDFDRPFVRSVLITNNSGVPIQYTVDGSNWTTVANAESAGLGSINPAAFRLRKTTSDSYPVPVNVSWRAADTESSSILDDGISLLPYRKALAKVASGSRARLLIYGDSTTVGAGAGTSTANLSGARALNWPTRLAAALTAVGIPAYNDSLVGDQNVSAFATYTNYDPRLSLTNFSASSLLTLGRAAWRAATLGANLAFTPAMTFDRFDIITASTTGTGSFTVNVDGGATLATVNTTSGGGNVVQKTTVSCTRGTHTINCTTTSATQVYIIAIIPYDSTVGGLDIIQAGWYGGKMVDFASSNDQWNCANSNILGQIAPDISIVQLTINDSTTETSPSSFASSLATVDSALGAASGAVMLMTGIPSGNAQATNGQLASILSAVCARANAQGRVLADLDARCGSYAAMNDAGWMTDTQHGNAKMYADEGRWMAKVLLDLAS